MLWGGVVFVVLIAAVNIANLALVRGNGRMKELATRNAIGAGHSRIARQLITEATILTIAGASLGVLLGYVSLDALEWIGFTDLPRAHEIRIDAVVLAATLAPAVLLGIAVGAGPAVQLARVNLSGLLREEGRSGTAGRTAGYVRRTLVVAQVGLAFVLLVGAGLLLASFQRLLGVDPGFVAAQVLTGRVSPLASRYPDDAALRSYADRALARVRALPGVEAAGITSYLPFSWDGSSSVIIPEGYAAKPGESILSPNQLFVSAGYLDALKVPVRRGPSLHRFRHRRRPEGRDRRREPRGAVLARSRPDWPPRLHSIETGRREESRARCHLAAGRGCGRRGQAPRHGRRRERQGRRLLSALRAGARARGIAWAIRSRGDVVSTRAAVQRALAEIDPEVALTDVFAMSERIEKSLNPRRAPMLLSLGFGAVALLLAAIGLYGVLAYLVGQRTREIGIRLALGSDASRILRLVLGEAGWLVALGLAGGFAGAVALRGAIAAQLYGVGALDPRVLLGAAAVLGITAAVACLGPARRAVQVSPLVALSRQ